jgi:hypothetical protein
MRRLGSVVLLVGIPFLVVVGASRADDIRLGYFSQLEGPHRAAIVARIDRTRTRYRPGTNGAVQAPARSQPQRSGVVRSPFPNVGGAGPSLPPAYPTISVTAPLARNPQPAGPQSFWYPDGFGHTCVFYPTGTPVCYTLVSPGGDQPPRPTADPGAIAAAVAKRLGLGPGEIKASPSGIGLTGAESWFWLEPAPRSAELSVTLGGETVTVSANPVVEWRFGDGVEITGGAGVPFEPGASAAGAIRHVYETRCLPGDPGRNPYVLPSCGADGYSVEALVVWHVSFSASGPMEQSGTLPTRTTESSAVYPVSESRAFLAGGASR